MFGGQKPRLQSWAQGLASIRKKSFRRGLAPPSLLLAASLSSFGSTGGQVSPPKLAALRGLGWQSHPRHGPCLFVVQCLFLPPHERNLRRPEKHWGKAVLPQRDAELRGKPRVRMQSCYLQHCPPVSRPTPSRGEGGGVQFSTLSSEPGSSEPGAPAPSSPGHQPEGGEMRLRES